MNLVNPGLSVTCKRLIERPVLKKFCNYRELVLEWEQDCIVGGAVYWQAHLPECVGYLCMRAEVDVAVPKERGLHRSFGQHFLEFASDDFMLPADVVYLLLPQLAVKKYSCQLNITKSYYCFEFQLRSFDQTEFCEARDHRFAQGHENLTVSGGIGDLIF